MKFESMEECLAHYGHRRIRDLKISGREPYINIELQPMRAHIYIEKNTALCEGIISKVVTLLTKRSSLYGFLTSYKTFFAIIVIANILTNPFLFPGRYLFSFASVPYGILVIYIDLRRHCSIYPSDSDSIADFWHRNKDSFITSVLAGSVGVILGIVIERFVLQ